MPFFFNLEIAIIEFLLMLRIVTLLFILEISGIGYNTWHFISALVVSMKGCMALHQLTPCKIKKNYSW